MTTYPVELFTQRAESEENGILVALSLILFIPIVMVMIVIGGLFFAFCSIFNIKFERT